MIANLMRHKHIKVLSFILFIFPIMFFLNSGFLTDDYWKIIQAFIFTIEFAVVVVWPKLKIFILWQILLMLVIMGLLYVAGIIEIADMVGSTAFGLVILSILSYLPQIVKLGYIKDL